MDVKIPFLGDGIESANVVSILVKPGDSVEFDQTLLELETDKATAPVPSTSSGVIDSILINEGDLVKEGMSVVKLKDTGENSSAPAETISNSKPIEVNESPLVVTAKQQTSIQLPVTTSSSYEMSGDISSVNASAAILKFAHLTGLDLTRIQGTGHSGRITWDDVKSYVTYLQASTFSETTPVNDEPVQKKISKPKVDFSKFGPVEHVKISSLRQKISDHLSFAWNDIPHVTQFADISIDSIMALRKSYNSKLKKSQMKLTVTIFVLKAILETLKKFENFNSSLVDDELIIKRYFNLGVAVDTDSGLVVPVIKNVDKKSLQEIASELDELAEKARNKALAVEDIQGATFTLSNLGGLGASHFTPIVNSPEVAILGTGRASFKPSYDEKTKKITNHLLMPVALSYDHRVIDGADGARFMSELVNNIVNFDKKWVK